MTCVNKLYLRYCQKKYCDKIEEVKEFKKNQRRKKLNER